MTLLRRVRVDSRRGERELRRLAGRSRHVISARTRRQARRIVSDIRRRGDKAVLAAVAQYDDVTAVRVSELRLPLWRGSDKEGAISAELVAALETAIQAVDQFHAPQVHAGYEQQGNGIWLQERRTPLRRVGIYIPGGLFPYFSTVLMTGLCKMTFDSSSLNSLPASAQSPQVHCSA